MLIVFRFQLQFYFHNIFRELKSNFGKDDDWIGYQTKTQGKQKQVASNSPKLGARFRIQNKQRPDFNAIMWVGYRSSRKRQTRHVRWIGPWKPVWKRHVFSQNKAQLEWSTLKVKVIDVCGKWGAFRNHIDWIFYQNCKKFQRSF